ncbi:MAG: hypothetical protein KAH44_02550 [Oricola sp.]|nr:hypothetical protein [Oricola sp.]
MADNVTDINAGKKPGGENALPDRATLSDLRRKVNGFKADMDEARGEMGALYKDASDNKNVH